MRNPWAVLVLLVGLLVAVGCGRQVAGTAQPDPHAPGTTVTEDGYGIIAVDPQAPVQIEIYTEPQCSHCADLQRDFGRQIASYINLGQLAVTYRPMTFLDRVAGGYSARVSNAMFLAAGPDTTGPAFQAFVEDLWSHQDPSGDGPSSAEIADMARDSGVGAAAVDKIAADDTALDVKAMDDANFGYLFEIDPVDTGTPTVYDLTTGEKLDIYDDNWLARVMASA
jgi:protein-disulfide isomerase